MSAFELAPGKRVLFEGKLHTVLAVDLNGCSAPYGILQCEEHNPDYCPAKHGKITWHVLEWAEPQARDDENSVLILLKGREPRIERSH